LIRRMAARHPEWHVVVIGRPSTSIDVTGLLPEPNIHYLGPKPFEQLPAYSRHFAVGLIPFQINPITVHCNPLKALEYMAAGLPVVSTDIPELRRYAGDVLVARSHEEFIALCERALADGSSAERDRRSKAAEAHSWESRVAWICDIVCQHMAKRAAR